MTKEEMLRKISNDLMNADSVEILAKDLLAGMTRPFSNPGSFLIERDKSV
ncbi:MAG: hypothetical protein OIN88_14905 [Candidatus Methanoperedens sp.]|nr:hypothetical protein [Candidatus Methanoperedens sp.]